MSRAWARIATLLGALLLALCLSGCEVRGTVDVLTEQDIAIDIVITGLNRGACSAATSGVSEVEVQRGINTSGQRFCRVRGVVKVEEVSGLTIASAAEYYVFTVEFNDVTTSWPASDLTVRFPGQVVDASQGAVSGSSLHLDDLSALAGGEPLQVVALSRPGPPWWLVAGAVGVAGGALAMFGYHRWSVGRRAEPQEAPDDEDSPDDQDWTTATLDESEPAMPSDEQFFAPPRVQPASQVWAAPRDGGLPAEPEAGPERRTETDHSVWAPPA